MGAAPLPRRAGQVRGDRLHEATVGVGGDQQHPGQATGDQVGEEPVPGLSGLAGHDFQPEDLTMAVGVHPGRDEHDGVDDPAVLPDLPPRASGHRQRIGGDEAERAGLGERTAAERGDLLIKVGVHPGDLRLRQAGDAEGLHELVDPAGRDAQQIAGRHHTDEGRLGSFAAFQQPVGEVAAAARTSGWRPRSCRSGCPGHGVGSRCAGRPGRVRACRTRRHTPRRPRPRAAR